jgi:hypothetical protein
MEFLKKYVEDLNMTLISYVACIFLVCVLTCITG